MSYSNYKTLNKYEFLYFNCACKGSNPTMKIPK